tara:strand:+ start:560 stop:847 length:288 start_codon:yes stop_codon:yes gene_type:complete
MKLPKIPKEFLTPELREVVGDTDLEFDAVVDPTDVFLIPETPDKDYLKKSADLSAEIIYDMQQQLNNIKQNTEKYEIQGHDKGCEENSEDSEGSS